MRRRLAFVLLALLALFSSAHPVAAEEITCFAAASLSNVLQEAASLWQKQGGEKVIFNFGASSALALQIQEGAPADLFFSADEAKMDQLEKKHLVAAGSRRSLLSNTLAIVVAAEGGPAIAAPQDLKKIKVLALAEPQTVPAGIYAKEYLKKLDLWASLIDKVVPTDNVRAALAAVEAGNADVAIVYSTDAAISKKVRVAFAVPVSEGPKISYPLALIAGSSHAEAARRFADFLASDPAKKLFREYGFLVP